MSDKKKTINPDKTMIITEKFEFKETTGILEPFLIQTSGRDAGKVYSILGRTIRIGRDHSCEVNLDDLHVSRFHAEVICEGVNSIFIRDTGSTNGVFVNGKRVSEKRLVDGDKIRIGTEFHFKIRFQDVDESRNQQHLYDAANKDGLTQLYNKKFFLDVLSREFSFSKRTRQPLSLLMIDVDYFKKINDTYGHLAGDMVLRRIGEYFLRRLRLENIACRYGGEEFCIVLRQVSEPQAAVIAERLRKGIEQEHFEYAEKEIPVTISVGIATYYNNNFEDYNALLEHADKCLYMAKQAGRNKSMHTFSNAA